MMLSEPVKTDLVLVGGGHAHALALRMLAMKALPLGARITLVSPASHTPYSGMLPGMVAGHYRFEDTHIDLARLCQWAGVRFITDEVIGFNPQKRVVHFANRPDLPYDIVSLDIGSQPDLDSVPGARAHAIPVKPVSNLWERWLAFTQSGTPTSQNIAVVGAGAGGVEMTLAMAQKLKGHKVQISLVAGGQQILPGYRASTRKAACAALRRFGVTVICGRRVARVSSEALIFEDGDTLASDSIFWCTAAAPAHWVSGSALATDARGFLLVNDALQSIDNPYVFATGDIASQKNHPRPKAGVYAVRQAPVLAQNLFSMLCAPDQSPPLRQHQPQKRFLSLLSLGERIATGERGVFHATGPWVWRWKDHIDRKFMRLFSELKPRQMPLLPANALAQAPCGGCGAKLGSDPLRSALATLQSQYPTHALPNNAADGDVATVPASGQLIVQSIDSLRPLVSDPYVMGKIAAQHALSDLYAAGAKPLSALAHVVLPYARTHIQQAELEQLLAGALEILSAADCPILGGHSLQGSELQVGFVVNGEQEGGNSLRTKDHAKAGDQLILTKALGTGALFAAHMQSKADGRDISGAIEQMCQSNAESSRVARETNVTAATDITGFGLLGHLSEMLSAGLGAVLSLGAIPILDGAKQASEQGIRSTLWHANHAAVYPRLRANAALATTPEFELLFDPQTSGGLLLCVSEERSMRCVEELRGAGINAAIIGSLVADSESSITIEP